jgi:hypothetical protein
MFCGEGRWRHGETAGSRESQIVEHLCRQTAIGLQPGDERAPEKRLKTSGLCGGFTERWQYADTAAPIR